MRKQILACILGLFLSISLFGTLSAVAGEPIKLLVDGNEIQCDVPPQIIDGRTMVPVRFAAQALGATVAWDEAANAVIITSAKAVTSSPASTPTGSVAGGQITLLVDGNNVQCDVPPQIINGRTMVPVRFVAEALGAKVEWVPSVNAVKIISETNVEIIPPPPPVPKDADLTTLTPVQCKMSTWIRMNKWVNGPFIMNGIIYNNGIAFMMEGNGPEAYVVYTINGQYSSLTGFFGTDDRDDSGNNNQMIVYGDGKELYRSPQSHPDSIPVEINVNITGVKQLKILFNTTYGKYPVLVNPVIHI